MNILPNNKGFTDDDLKRLKEIHADNPQLCMAHISVEEFTALLARLEAAEYARNVHAPLLCDCKHCEMWRKAAGNNETDEKAS